jgi:hypothetical protein
MSQIRPRVLIRLDREWSPVGHASVMDDPASGIRFVRLDLSAMAGTIYVALADLRVLLAEPAPTLELGLDTEVVGHA